MTDICALINQSDNNIQQNITMTDVKHRKENMSKWADWSSLEVVYLKSFVNIKCKRLFCVYVTEADLLRGIRWWLEFKIWETGHVYCYITYKRHGLMED